MGRLCKNSVYITKQNKEKKKKKDKNKNKNLSRVHNDKKGAKLFSSSGHTKETNSAKHSNLSTICSQQILQTRSVAQVSIYGLHGALIAEVTDYYPLLVICMQVKEKWSQKICCF